MSLHSSMATACKEALPVPLPFPAGLKVLVVDDDLTCLKILEQMLTRCMYRGRYWFFKISVFSLYSEFFYQYISFLPVWKIDIVKVKKKLRICVLVIFQSYLSWKFVKLFTFFNNFPFHLVKNRHLGSWVNPFTKLLFCVC